MVKLVNCQLIRDHKIQDDQLLIRDGVILDPEAVFYDEKRIPDEIIDCDGHILAPGFIDLQINGED